MQANVESQWQPYLQRFMDREWRARIFRDMVLADAGALESERGKLAILDIGCGGGFHSDAGLQESIARVAGRYIGVEPDTQIELGRFFDATHRCRFEDAGIEPGSIDLAFAVMVLEHLEDPGEFWDKVHRSLSPGGVFWAFTVDARHWFVAASKLTERLGVKDIYLDLLHGKRGEERYENYETHYRTNTPAQVAGLVKSFSNCTVLNFRQVGQLDYYFPKPLRWTGRIIDRLAMRMDWPGSVLAVRVEK
jgi:SAM-dependent methyltransferase